MSFMQSYKRLDKLCKDINGIGVTGYIDEMTGKYNMGLYRVSCWETDYKKLKSYRHIRNQIAHEENANEENLTDKNDCAWIECFYTRILNQKDPLSVLYQKSKMTQKRNPPKQATVKASKSSSKSGCLTVVLKMTFVAAFIVAFVSLFIK